MRYHNGDGFAHMADCSCGKGNLGPLVKNRVLERGWQQEERARLPISAQIRCCVKRHYSGQRLSFGSIDGMKQDMGIVAADKGNVQHARLMDVVGKDSLSGQEARIFVATDWLAKI